MRNDEHATKRGTDMEGGWRPPRHMPNTHKHSQLYNARSLHNFDEQCHHRLRLRVTCFPFFHRRGFAGARGDAEEHPRSVYLSASGLLDHLLTRLSGGHPLRTCLCCGLSLFSLPFVAAAHLMYSILNNRSLRSVFFPELTPFSRFMEKRSLLSIPCRHRSLCICSTDPIQGSF